MTPADEPRAPLGQSFLAHCDPRVARQLEKVLLEPILESLLDRARRGWPELALDEEGFVAHLAQRLSPEEDVAASLPVRNVADLYLAFGCIKRHPKAVAELHKLMTPEVLGPLAGSDDVRDELAQTILVGREGQPPAIGGYSGRGRLTRWLCASALRAASKIRRKANREAEVERFFLADGEGSGSVIDPELEIIRAHYREDFNAAFHEAIASLAVRERNVLRLYSGGLSIERIGDCYRVHRATVHRWLTTIRASLLERTKTRLGERLQIPPTDVESLLRLLRSELDVSLRLGEPEK